MAMRTAAARWGERRLRILLMPALVAVGVAVSYGVFLQLGGTPYDDQVLNASFLTDRLVTHVVISLVSFGFVAAIGVPLGVLIAGAGRPVRIPVFLLANLGQAIPSIGILVLLYAFLGLGTTPAVTALVAYGTLPVLRNTVAGIQGVDPAAV